MKPFSSIRTQIHTKYILIKKKHVSQLNASTQNHTNVAAIQIQYYATISLVTLTARGCVFCTCNLSTPAEITAGSWILL